MKKELWKGNEAIAEAAVRGGCDGFFGYPITPQSEVPEYLSVRLPQAGKVFVQSESEVAAINMVYGAAASGKRAMTSSSGVGIALKQEGISYMMNAQLPAVIVNVMRGGPGLGTIQPAQADYNQATRGGGPGDYHMIVLTPNNVQETVDMVQEAFEIADYYRNPTMVLVDGMIGQMMEAIEWREIPKRDLPPKSWAAGGRFGREHSNFVMTLQPDAKTCNALGEELAAKYAVIQRDEVCYEEINTEDAELVFVAYGTSSRLAMSAAERLKRDYGIRAGIFRPKTVWPFPEEQLRALAEREHVKALLVVEMSLGQMVQDVRRIVAEKKPVAFFGHTGGLVPTVKEIVNAALETYKEEKDQ